MGRKEQEHIKIAWKNYISDKSSEDRHILILNYIGLIRYVYYNMKLPSDSLLEDNDFINYGVIGLCEAIERFDPERGVKFESYAVSRIKGRIQDELRKLDWLSRTARKKAGELLHLTDKLSSETGRQVGHQELIDHLNITPQKFRTYLEAAAAAKSSVSLSSVSSQSIIIDGEEYDILQELEDKDQKNILTALEDTERIDYIVDYLTKIKEKKRLVISLYYYEDLTFKEIGSILNISESRVCQIHTQVIKDMRNELYKNEYV